MQPHACFEAQQQCCCLLGVVPYCPLQGAQNLVGVGDGNQLADQQDPPQKHQQADRGAEQRSVGPDGAVGNETSVWPPDSTQRAPTVQGIGPGIEVRRQPKASEQECRKRDASCGWAEQRCHRQPEGQAPSKGCAVMLMARRQGSPFGNQAQSAVLRQNLHLGRLAQR